MATTITKYPAAYKTISGQTNSTNYQRAIGKGASATGSGNDYASGGQSATATYAYSFDFSEIPAGATIDSVEVKVGGHAETSTYSSQRKCEFQLYAGDTPKGTMDHFTSSSKQVKTMNPGTWTRDELQGAQLRVTIAYYGGLVNGVDFTVTYTEAVKGPQCWMQINGQIRAVAKLWKQVNSQIVEIQPSELDTSANYFVQ